MRVVVGETAEMVTALSLSCEKGLSRKISIYLIPSACLMGISSFVKKYQQRFSESAGDVWGGRSTVRMFCLPAVRCLLGRSQQCAGSDAAPGPGEQVLPYQPCITPRLPALGFVPAALGQASPCIA